MTNEQILREFVRSITDAAGKYTYLDGTPIVSAAYDVLAKTERQNEGDVTMGFHPDSDVGRARAAAGLALTEPVLDDAYKSGYATGYSAGYKDGKAPACSLATGESVKAPANIQPDETPIAIIQTNDLKAHVQNKRGNVRVQFAFYEPVRESSPFCHKCGGDKIDVDKVRSIFTENAALREQLRRITALRDMDGVQHAFATAQRIAGTALSEIEDGGAK